LPACLSEVGAGILPAQEVEHVFHEQDARGHFSQMSTFSTGKMLVATSRR
jgi:hypothetical protein